jgi:tetratricopeptide (TPR) repeat protein
VGSPNLGELVGGRFAVESRATSGGMGAVYRARDRLTDATVALKVVHSSDAHAAARFAREQAVLAQLVHPAIVRYVAHGRLEDGSPWLAMDWLDGEDLSARLARQPLTLDETLRLARQAADALGAAHARGIVHRDVKPGNVFLLDGDVDRVRLLDFGLARLRDASEVTRTGVMVGTPSYMAPEQIRQSGRVDARADVFSLGCLMWRCIVGQTPFQGEALVAILATILNDPAPRLRDARPDVSRELDALVDSMLAKEPDARPADGNAVARALESMPATLSPAAAASRAPPSMRVVALTTSERRLVSVLLARSDATARSADHAREAPTMQSTSLEIATARAARDAVLGLGADVQLLADGTMIATMTGQGEAREQAARAARCAIVLRGRLPETALVLATVRADGSASRPFGALADQAARLLRDIDASGDESDMQAVRIDETTAGLLDARFEVRSDAAGLTLHGERGADVPQRLLLGRASPFVGRARELATLGALLDECAQDSVARAVLVTGPPGVGKSRLRFEFLRGVRARGDVQVWLALADPLTSQSPFQVTAQIVRRTADILDGEPLETRREKLQARVARRVAAPEVDRVAVFLGELADVAFDDAGRDQLRHAREDAIVRGDQMRRAWEDWVAAETQAGPLVIVLEDVHWSDAASVRLVDAMLRNLADRPLLVLGLARPAVHDTFPRLWAERQVVPLPLTELTPKAAERLVRDALGAHSDDDAMVSRVVGRAAGNAFYLEELIRSVASGAEELPESVLAMVETRLAGLEAEARRVLRAASVFGQVFWRGGVQALLGQGDGASAASEWLDVLAEREIVTARDRARFPDEREYRFRHALVQDAAYAMLTETDRSLGHRLAGQWLQSVGEQDAALLARHFEEGGDTAKAVDLYVRAATNALAADDFAGAIAHAEKAAGAGAQGETLGAMRLVQAEASRFVGRPGDAEKYAVDAMGRLEDGGAKWCAAVAEFASARHRLGNVVGLEELAHAVLARLSSGKASPALAIVGLRLTQLTRYVGLADLADELFDAFGPAGAASDIPQVTARYQLALAGRRLFEGDPAAFAAAMRGAAEAFERAGDLRSACNPRINVGYANVELGRYAEAEHALRAVGVTARRLGLRDTLAQCEQNLGVALVRLGRLDEALALETRACEEFVAQDYPRMEGAARVSLSEILLAKGDAAGAEREARAAVEKLATFPPMRAHALALVAAVLLARHRAAEAMAPAREAMEILQSSAGLETGEALVRLTYAEALSATGERERAREVISAGRDRLLARAAAIGDADSRERFLSTVPENARTLAMAVEAAPPRASDPLSTLPPTPRKPTDR